MSDGRPEGWRRRLRVAVAATVGGGLIRLLAMTWRVTTRGGEGLREVRAAKRGAVFVVWHGELLPAVN